MSTILIIVLLILLLGGGGGYYGYNRYGGAGLGGALGLVLIILLVLLVFWRSAYLKQLIWMRASGAAWIFSQFVVAVGMGGLSAPSELARSAPETAVEQRL